MICPNCGGYVDDAYPSSNVDRGDMVNAIYDCGCGAIIYANIPRMDGMLTEPIVHHFRVIRNKEQFQDRPNKERTFTVQRNGGFTENVPFSVLKSEIPGIQAMRIGDHAIGVSGDFKAIRVSNEKPAVEIYEVRGRKPESYPIGVVGSDLPQPGAASPGGATTDCSVTPSKEGARKLGGSSTATPQPAHCMLGGSSTATPQPARYDDIGPGVYKDNPEGKKKNAFIALFSTKPRKKKPMSFCPKCKQYERIPMRRVNVGPGKIAERIECCNCGYVEMMPIAEWMNRNDDERINWRDYQ